MTAKQNTVLKASLRDNYRIYEDLTTANGFLAKRCFPH